MTEFWIKYFKEYVYDIKHNFHVDKRNTILRLWEDKLKTDIYHTYEDHFKYNKEIYFHPHRIKDENDYI